MAVKSSVDLGAFFGAAFLTVAVALFVAWSYSLDVTVLLRFPGLVYLSCSLQSSVCRLITS